MKTLSKPSTKVSRVGKKVGKKNTPKPVTSGNKKLDDAIKTLFNPKKEI